MTDSRKSANPPIFIADRRHTDSLKWAKYANRDILPMWVADMDFQSAPQILSALHERIDHGVFGYACPTEDTAAAVVDWLRDRHHWNIRPEWIVWTPGLVSALNVVCRAFAGPSQKVLTFTPIYPPFLSAPVVSGRGRITCLLDAEQERYCIDFERLNETITEDTAVLLLCSPHNPTGRILNRDELLRLSEFCLQRNIILCSDEIHCDLILDVNVRHIPTATLSEQIAQNTITLMSPAKTFNLPGLNCGYAVIPNEAHRKTFRKAADGIVPHVNALGYTACRAAYRFGAEWLDSVLEYLRENHALLLDRICRIPGLSMQPVQATYLAWIDVRALNLTDPAEFFEQAGVGVLNGFEFGRPGYIRLNFACSRDLLESALDRIEKALLRTGNC